MGATEHVGGPFTDREALEKSSSDGLVKEALIWQHRALIVPSPSPGSPISMSAMSKKKTRAKRKKGNEWGERESERGKKKKDRNCFFIFPTDPVSINGLKMERVTLIHHC